jgi:cathepsin X
LIRGVDNLGIESTCSWANPRDTWTKDERNKTKPSLSESKPTKFLSISKPTCRRESPKNI